MKVAVILPAYNEEGNVAPLVAGLVEAAGAAQFELDILVVDDGSTDATAAEVSSVAQRYPQVNGLRHPKNLGMARALKTGMAAGQARGCDAAVFMDCDLSHRPQDLPRLIAGLRDGADVALGSRFVPGGGMDGVPLWRVLISRAGNAFGRRLLGLPVHDLTSGYRAVRRAVLDRWQLGEDGFTIQLEMVVKSYAAGFTLVEVPIVLGTRRHGASHMNYSVSLFRDYWRLLMASRRWLREKP